MMTVVEMVEPDDMEGYCSAGTLERIAIAMGQRSVTRARRMRLRSIKCWATQAMRAWDRWMMLRGDSLTMKEPGTMGREM
jgi:hypothetical protein